VTRICDLPVSLTTVTSQRCAELVVLARGGRIGYYSGSPLRIVEDLGVLKPNFFPSVPRLLNRIYQMVMAAADAPGLKGALLRRAIHAKLERLEATGVDTHPLWDRLVFKKVCNSSIFPLQC
jgi:long-chain acyl-CoA synthetase